MHSLRWKLALSLLLVVAVSVGLTAYLTNRSTAREFSQYVSQSQSSYVAQLQQSLGEFYADRGSWSGVQDLFDQLPSLGSNRFLLANSSGVIVGDTQASWLGRTVSSLGLTDPASVVASGREVGRIYVVSSWMGHGWGPMMGMGNGMMGMGNDTTSVEQPAVSQEETFLGNLNRSLWIAGGVGAAVALLLGLALTRQVTVPVKRLKRGSSRVASGDLAYRVNVESKDEFGELAKSFNSMADSLYQSEQTRRRLFADIAHELRTPLTVIEGTVDAMLDGVFEVNPGNLNSIKEETALLTRLVADLRDLALAESGQLKLELGSTDIGKLVQQRVSQAEVVAREKGISLKSDIAEGLPPADADGRRIGQAVSNLLSNALNHTPQGGVVSIAVAAGSHPDGKEGLLVSIADTGEGISPEHLPHIFERFYRVDEARSRAKGGSGLGLAIAKQMVELHGGRLWAESQAGKGSTFYFTLPATSAGKRPVPKLRLSPGV